ncbi:hypothetical protein D9M68_946170 [compost metagenome]
MLLTLLVASEMRSSATAWVLRWIDRPSFTKDSKALPPSSCALEKAPRPASQICWAESLMAPDSGELNVCAVAFLSLPFFWIFLTMGCSCWLKWVGRLVARVHPLYGQAACPV